MIHIDVESKEPSEEWCGKARELTKKLMELDSDEERKELIERNDRVWKELKGWLCELSHNKCWYSEAKELYSPYHVDHFRPKSSAKELDGSKRAGYWWLAFDWKNYRISGATGNIKKSDYFPLREGSPVATVDGCDICEEITYLLDPTNPADPLLLMFDSDGLPKPAVREEKWEYQRVMVTIKLLRLDYPPLVDERKKIWKFCERLVTKAQNLMKESNQITDETRSIFEQLRDRIAEDAQLSAAARACLMESKHPSWVHDLVASS